jgi:hypothetical protein
MPAPAVSALVSKFKSLYTATLSPEGEEYVETFFGKLSSSWGTWQSGIKVGGATVNGVGVGAWAGSGGGGSAQGGPFQLEPFVFKKQAKPQEKLTLAFGKAVRAKFSDYISSVKTKPLSYVGASTASPTSPGNFNAVNVPTPLVSAFTGTTPQGIAQIVLAELTPPDFDISNPQAKTKELVNAIAGAIEQVFTETWLTSSSLSGNSVSGPAAPTGTGSSPSLLDGTIV